MQESTHAASVYVEVLLLDARAKISETATGATEKTKELVNLAHIKMSQGIGDAKLYA